MRAEDVQVPEAIHSFSPAIRHSGSLSSMLQYHVNATILESHSFDFMPWTEYLYAGERRAFAIRGESYECGISERTNRANHSFASRPQGHP
jgi:hypothetical protein